jgi:hypothetical protein
MSQKKIGGSIALLAGLSAMVFSIYLFMLGSSTNNNLLNVILYLCSGASFFFWGIHVLIPNKKIERNPTSNKSGNPLS